MAVLGCIVVVLGCIVVVLGYSGGIGLYSGGIGLYSGGIGLYSGGIGLYSGGIGLYSGGIGLYSGGIGLGVHARLHHVFCNSHSKPSLSPSAYEMSAGRPNVRPPDPTLSSEKAPENPTPAKRRRRTVHGQHCTNSGNLMQQLLPAS